MEFTAALASTVSLDKQTVSNASSSVSEVQVLAYRRSIASRLDFANPSQQAPGGVQFKFVGENQVTRSLASPREHNVADCLDINVLQAMRDI